LNFEPAFSPNQAVLSEPVHNKELRGREVLQGVVPHAALCRRRRRRAAAAARRAVSLSLAEAACAAAVSRYDVTVKGR